MTDDRLDSTLSHNRRSPLMLPDPPPSQLARARSRVFSHHLSRGRAIRTHNSESALSSLLGVSPCGAPPPLSAQRCVGLQGYRAAGSVVATQDCKLSLAAFFFLFCGLALPFWHCFVHDSRSYAQGEEGTLRPLVIRTSLTVIDGAGAMGVGIGGEVRSGGKVCRL
ncbi:hypothetical protein HDK64DRAFT_121013 [Phyllosticta capitalensis]